MAVGDRQGQVYISKEGYGEAAILPSVNTFNQASAVAQGLFKKKAPVNKNQIMKDIRQGKPEWWISHDNDISKEFDNLLNYAADISAAGVDPTKAGDKASADFQNKFAKLEADAKLSLQKRDQFNAWKTKIDADPKKYTDKSITDGYNHFGKGFKAHKETGELPPRLVPKDAPYTYSKNLRAGAGNFKTTNPGYTPEDLKQNTEIAFADPSQREGIVNALQPRYDQLVIGKDGNPDPLKVQILEQQAVKSGFGEPMEMLFHQDFKSQLGQEALDVTKMIKGAMPALSVEKSSYENKANVTTSSRDVWLDPVKAKGASEMLIDSQPRLLQELQTKGLATDRNSAVDYLSKQMKNFAKEEKERGTKRDTDMDWGGFGYSRKEVEEDWDVFDKLMRGDLEELPGYGKLTAEERLLARQLTGSYIEGAKFGKDGVIVVEGEFGRTGGKGRIETKRTTADIALSNVLGSPQNYGEYPIAVEYLTGSEKYTDPKTGQEGTRKTKKTETSYGNVIDRESKDFISETQTQGMYQHGLKKGKLFSVQLIEAFENKKIEEARELEAGFTGFTGATSSGTNKSSKSTSKKKGKLNF